MIDTRKTKEIRVYLPKSLKQEISREAKRKELSVSSWVKEVVERYLSNNSFK